ncbi:LamB/YcsF family protein [Cohnella terricola]|uniref:5-oxoprolinase subunit PxpA n=1 Tax=Cohnella terricola TaxID=1289167 RepID=A0A559JEL3_9BACL|nr:5-oxoprolinase subunit PxpA [Cohnella terricola]TVX98306.1 5-oxoprolinase subunit PxpA [Cohnella terricola]
MNEIDINADLGESFGAYEWGADETLLQFVSSANIACGFHAGDPHAMRRTAESCVKRGVAIGAHPGLPDRLGFGRREMAVTPEEAADFVLYQTGALQAFVHAAGGKLRHVKLHGALYHMASKDERLAVAIVKVVHQLDPKLLLYGPPAGRLLESAAAVGLRYVVEGFADRLYLSDGTLAPRQLPGAVLDQTESVVRQALSLAREGAIRTLCVHGDTARAAEHAERIAEALREAGITVRPPR